tara:strand:+ start:4196 stop:5437 length:1242 start_codon:yes stop_codon:yes gene_type:complete
MQVKPISNRGSVVCRGCDSKNLVSILDLGEQPLPAEYGMHADEVLDKFPLHLRICKSCGLGQLGEYVLPERIFHETYPYLSSASEYWVNHATNFAIEMVNKLSLNKESLVIELGGNDGYLLSQFQKLGVSVLNVEPPENTAEIARQAGVPTISKFFGVDLANEILLEYGNPDLICVNNVYAHIPDQQDFTKGMEILSGDTTTITIENPSFDILLNNAFFDTIYHEHYSYLTAHSVDIVSKKCGLKLFHVDRLPTHGGSNRYWLSKSQVPDDTVKTVLDEEKASGLFDEDKWKDFAARSNNAINGLREWFIEREKLGHVVVGYGAAHKGNTFLNAVGEASRTLKYVVDASHEKHGKFLPGSQVPVLSPEKLNSENPHDVLILPWNIADELSSNIKKLAPDANIWVAQPSMKKLN